MVRRASCGLQLQASAAWLARRRCVGARCLWGGDAALELALCARGAALAVIGSCLIERCRTGETALSFGARPWCDVPAATSNFKPAPRVSRSTGASALAVSGMEAQHSSLLRVRAVLRSIWPVFTLSNGAATARCFSLPAQNRGAMCQLRPLIPSQRRVARAAKARRRSLSLGRRRSTRACFACAWYRDGYGRSVPCQKTLRRRDSPPLRRGRGETNQLQPPASCQRRVTRATLARRHFLCLGRRHSTRPCCARAVLRWS